MEKQWLQKSKLKSKLKFLYHHTRYLTSAYERLLYNVIIQPHFDYGCSSGFPLLKKNLELKLKKAQNKCIRFFLNIPPRSRIDPSHFRKINLFLTSYRVGNYILSTVFKYWNEIAPGYLHEMIKPLLCRWHWTYCCGKQIQCKKAYSS